jgi:hypothetical protein
MRYLITLIICLLAGAAGAAELVSPAPEEFLDPVRLEVKFKDGTTIRVRHGLPADTASGRAGVAGRPGGPVAGRFTGARRPLAAHPCRGK